ncbi:MAG: hypothetical protein Q4D29_04185 [Lachnospiraceae bacterium]|nr:hypothetical protein [Lachnospiraceae bacterium]
MSSYVNSSKETAQDTILNLDVPVKTRRDLTEDERNLIGDIRAGINKKYKMFCWSMRGPVTLQANNKRYAELINKYEVFRRRYLYKSVKRPLCAILEQQEQTSFSVLDLRKESLERKKECIKNIAVAEARDVFNPEESAPLKIRVLVMEEDRIVIIMKAYMYVNLPMSPFDIRRFIFYNMRMDSDSVYSIDEEKIEYENMEITNKCFDYWRKTLKDVEKPVLIPFSNNDVVEESVFYTVRKTIDPELCKKIYRYIDKKECKLEYAFLHEYGHIFGEASDTKLPLLAVRKSGSFMQIMPCKVDLNKKVSESYEELLVQDTLFYKYNQCGFDDAMNAAGISVLKFFNIMIEFVEEDEDDNRVLNILKSINSGSVSEIAPRLEILVTYSRDGIQIKYSYDAQSVNEHTVDAIHDLFEKALEERITAKDGFSWKEYVTDYKTREEQIQKLTIAQKSLYIKEAEFLMSDDPEDFIKLSTKGTYGNYIAEDIALEQGKIINKVGIIISGHLEEREKDIDGILKTLSVYKAGYIVGLESVASIDRSPFEYVAADDARVLWLDADVLKEILQKYPMSYEALMRRVVLDTHRVKKLWALD